jgi:hypothetical protein
MKLLPHLVIGGYLIVLLLGYGFVGWLLAAFQAAWPIWLGTFAITLYLICAGPAAIAFSQSWIVSIMTLAAVLKSWTPAWGSQVPFEQAQLWAKGLLLIWLAAISLAVLLGFASTVLQPWKLNARLTRYSLILLLWTALGLGGLAY